MKIIQNHLTQRRVLTLPMLIAVLICTLLITMYGCGKPANNPIPDPVNITGSAIASAVDQALGLRNFEYDDKGLW